MKPIYLLILLLMASACDTGGSSPEPEPETGPSGQFTLAPVAFRLFLVVDQALGITEDLQATIEGSLNLSVDGGVVSGSGSCTWSSRRYIARHQQETLESQTRSFSVSGTLNDSQVAMMLSGCAWVQVAYQGTWTGEQYDLRVSDVTDSPVFGPEVWAEASVLEGDPQALVLVRE